MLGKSQKKHVFQNHWLRTAFFQTSVKWYEKYWNLVAINESLKKCLIANQ